MTLDSRKAQRDRYAHLRVTLLFAKFPAHGQERTPSAAAVPEGTGPALARERVRAGIIGFVPATATAGQFNP